MNRWVLILRSIRQVRDRLWHLAAGGIVLLSFTGVALAQASGITPDQLQQLRKQSSDSPSSSSPVSTQSIPSVSSRETILEPTAPSAPLTTSDLEQILSSRAGTTLRLYGYDQIGVGRAVSQPQVGAVQDNYVLGVGDEVVLTLRGQENSEYRAQVDRDGNVTFPRLNPVSAAGRSFGRFRQDLMGAVHRAFVSTEGFVTIGRIRQISVLVSGEVGSPGVRTLTGLSTVSDAIFVSGGIKKSGSLRNVQIKRGGQVIVVDLYSIIMSGVQSKNAVLADGDKIVVPPLGATVAIAGQVRRPGIYELPSGRSQIGVREAVRMASGMALPGRYTVSLLRTMLDGRRQLVDVSDTDEHSLHDGEIVVVKAAVDISLNQVTLAGAVRTPGTVALGKFKTLHDLLPSADALKPGAYMLIGVIDRVNPKTLQRSALPFSPLRVIEGRENQPLLSDDTVRILTLSEMRQLLAQSPAGRQQFAGDSNADKLARLGALDATGSALGATTQKPSGADSNAASSLQPDAISQALAGAAKGGLTGAMGAPAGGGNTGAVTVGGAPSALGGGVSSAGMADANALGEADGAFFGKSLSDYWVAVNGAVHFPGTYLVAPDTTLAEVLAEIGGLVDDANLESFDITSTMIDNNTGSSTTSRSNHPATQNEFEHVIVRSFDRIEFRRVFSDKYYGAVRLTGEVRYPGIYNILRHERLSSLLQRAGGMTDVAYPDGTVFLRLSVARAEDAENQRLIKDMRNQLITYLMKPVANNASAPNADAVAAVEKLLAQLGTTEALGRIPVVADLDMLNKRPQLDTFLEPGDSIVVPTRPATVLVMGEVLRPGAQRYVQSASVDDYLDMAGGTTEIADTGRVIVVLPDGSVRKMGSSWLSFGFGSDIPPGSTILAPRALDMYTTRLFITDTLQIFSQLATSAAALAVLSKQ